MSNVPVAIRAAIEPQVNLIPPEIAGRKAQSQRTGLIVLAFVALLGLIIVATYVAGTVRNSAQATLDQSMAEKSRIETEIASYQYVIDAQTQLANATGARLYAGAAEVQWDPMLRNIRQALPFGTTIDTIEWSPTTIDSAAPTGVAPVFSVPDIGFISIAGQSLDATDIPLLQDSLDKVPGLARARVLTVVAVQPSDGGLIWTFTATVRFTFDALSGHFTDDWLANRDFVRAGSFFSDQESSAQGDLDAAQADVVAGVAGATGRVGDATKAIGENKAWLAQMMALVSLYETDLFAVSKAQTDVVAATGGSADDVKKAQDALTAAQASLATHRDAVNAFTKVALRYAAAVRAVGVEEARIAVADDAASSAADAVASAQAAVVAKTEGAAAELATAQEDKAAADAALRAEQALLPDLNAAAATAKSNLVAAAAEAAKVAPVKTSGSGS